MTYTATAGAPQAAGDSQWPAAKSFGLFTGLLWVQGLYYLMTGVWPLVSIDTFQMVTGPKTDHLPTGRESDHWLVMTVGVLITAIGIALVVAAWRRRHPPETAVLAITSALGLIAIDVIYVARHVIAPIYLVDAVAEMLLIAVWTLALGRQWGVMLKSSNARLSLLKRPAPKGKLI
jgi:hypothetical protein